MGGESRFALGALPGRGHGGRQLWLPDRRCQPLGELGNGGLAVQSGVVPMAAKEQFPGAMRVDGAAFAINNQGYYSTLSGTGLKHVWQYTASTQHIAGTAPGGSVTVFPNPGDGRFRIAGGPAGILSLRVYDLTGKMLLEQQDLQPGQALPDLSAFGKSVYTLEIRSSAGVARVKLVVD